MWFPKDKNVYPWQALACMGAISIILCSGNVEGESEIWVKKHVQSTKFLNFFGGLINTCYLAEIFRLLSRNF